MRLPKGFVELLLKARSQFHWKIGRGGEIRTREKRGEACMCPIEAAYVASGRPLLNDYGFCRAAEDVARKVGFRSPKSDLVMCAADCFSDDLLRTGNKEELAVRRRLLSILGLEEPKSRRAR